MNLATSSELELQMEVLASVADAEKPFLPAQLVDVPHGLGFGANQLSDLSAVEPRNIS